YTANMQKETWLGAVVLVIAIGAIFAYAGYESAHAPGATTGSIEQEGQYYSINASWPTVTPLAKSAGKAADQAAAALMSTAVQTTVTQFASEPNLASITPDNATQYGITQSGEKYTLDVTYVATSTRATDSYVFAIYFDTLGAHPNGTYGTYTFDAVSGQRL